MRGEYLTGFYLLLYSIALRTLALTHRTLSLTHRTLALTHPDEQIPSLCHACVYTTDIINMFVTGGRVADQTILG